MTVNFSTLKQYFTEQNFYYSDELLYNFFISLKTKPFVILSGISGSGKSKIIDLFSDFYAKELSYNDNYELVPVKPNWTDNRGIFGFHNIIDNTYAITSVIKLFLRAQQNRDKPYFLVIDEMNLAKVEHYFSDFLSVIESRKETITASNSVRYTFNESKQSEIPSLSLPDLTIIAGIDMDLFRNYATVPEIRNNRIYQIWMNAHPESISHDNWTPRSRTEVNNKVKGQPGRFAPKFFISSEGDDELYRFRTFEELQELMRTPKVGSNEMLLRENDIKRFENLREEYFIRNEVASESEIVQEPIVLHQANVPLKTYSEQDAYSQENQLYDESTDSYYVPSTIEIPLNVFVIGTVNVDETTYMFSPKVLDRSNVIEFNTIDLFGAYQIGTDTHNNSITLSDDTLDLTISLAKTDDTKWFAREHNNEFQYLLSIFTILQKKNKHFGYRVFNEISAYIKNYNAQFPNHVKQALDYQILQKILPKLNGDIDDLQEVLEDLSEALPNADFPNSAQKINEMVNTLEQTGYVTFIK